MADNIGGATLHSFFQIPFKDRRGLTINSAQADDNWNAKLTKMSLLQFICVDEVEAAGVDLLGKAEHEVRLHTRRPAVFRYPQSEDGITKAVPRAWGGVNLILIGDWWQLQPTGGIAIMSHPLSHSVQNSSAAQATMASLWCQPSDVSDLNAAHYMLQEWAPKERVLELSTNIRSGEDEWWNEVLEQCRRGELSEDNYDWIHGFPAKASIASAPLKFWYAHRKDATKPCVNEKCNDSCSACRAEVLRRNRSLHVVKTSALPTQENAKANSLSELM